MTVDMEKGADAVEARSRTLIIPRLCPQYGIMDNGHFVIPP